MNEPNRIRLKFAAREPLKYGANAAAEFDEPRWPRFVRITDVNSNGTLRDETFRSLPPEIAEPFRLDVGDILLARSGATVGKSFIYDEQWGEACFAGYLIRFRTGAGYEPKFIYWWLQSSEYWSAIDSNLVQATIQNVSADRYGNFEIPVFPIETQRRIARFLDEKAARIDALIEKKQALLERLAEKRQALITRAATKGLNPDVPMKPSGVEWLGDIPEHWEVKPLKRHIKKIEQGWSPQTEGRMAEADEWGVLKSGCVNLGIYDENEHKALPAHLDARHELEVKADDVLMSRASGSLQYIGSVALVEHTRPKLMFSDKTYRISMDPSITDRAYFVFTMLAKHLRDQIRLSVSGAEGLANNIPQSSVQDYQHAFPPLLEQEQIAAFLRDSIGELSVVEDKIIKSIKSLQTYRSVLVTAAVTGQLPELNG